MASLFAMQVAPWTLLERKQSEWQIARESETQVRRILDGLFKLLSACLSLGWNNALRCNRLALEAASLVRQICRQVHFLIPIGGLTIQGSGPTL